MDNMLIVVLMVVSCILINPFVSASEVKAVEQTQLDDLEGDSDDNEEIEDEEEQLSN